MASIFSPLVFFDDVCPALEKWTGVQLHSLLGDKPEVLNIQTGISCSHRLIRNLTTLDLKPEIS